MSRFAEIENGIVTNIIICEPQEIASFPGVWVDSTDKANVMLGSSYDVGSETFTLPNSATETQYKTIIDQAEFVSIWSPSEWRTLKKAAAGDLSPSPVPDNVSEQLDQLFDAIRLTNSFDVSRDNRKANQLFDYLESQGLIDAARKEELQRGVEDS